MAEIVFVLFNLPALAVLISAILLLTRGKSSKSIRNHMAMLLVPVALSIAFYAEYYNPFVAAGHIWGFNFMYCLISPFCAPVYFLFLNRFTDVRSTPILNVMVFLPAIIYAAMLVTAQLLMNDAERHAYISNVIFGQSIQIEHSIAYGWMSMIGNHIFKIFVPLEAIVVMVYGEFKLSEYVRLYDDFYSSDKEQNTGRLRRIHTVTILMAAMCVFILIIPVYDLAGNVWLVGTVIFMEVIMVAIGVYYVMQRDYSAENLRFMIASNPVKPAETPLPESMEVEAVPSLIARVESVMVNDKLYLNPELSLVFLAEYLGSNRTYVSKAIKDAKGCNFSDYVNRYRLDYAIDLMTNAPKDAIVVQNIAAQCGCGSIQTFYRYFKLFYNETPTQWIERNK
ncbi:MAG: AraC family transcriptional regulator [Bacteroidaceae bacterium]|nr:AraC family transcriptional regulator [Bacteroidaceae bacterium]